MTTRIKIRLEGNDADLEDWVNASVMDDWDQTYWLTDDDGRTFRVEGWHFTSNEITVLDDYAVRKGLDV